MEGSSGVKKLKFLLMGGVKRHYKRRLLFTLFGERYIKKQFKKALGYELDVEHPQTLNEKIQWFKLFVRDSLFTQCADKLAVRKYIQEKIGEKYLVPLYGAYESISEIDLAKLPEHFVLKPNHECGRVIVCHDKNDMDWEKEADKMNVWLHENYYYETGEWQYKNMRPYILCEKLLEGEIIDYKFFCAPGRPMIVEIVGERANGHYKNAWFDLSFSRISEENEEFAKRLKKPEHWEEMIAIAKKLSEDFPFVRVDLYDLEGQVFFGELTFTSNNGMDQSLPKEWDHKLGQAYDLCMHNPKFLKKTIYRIQ